MKVFVSSTYDDLVIHRQHVRDMFTRCEIIYKGMEFFGAYPNTTLEHCLDQVRRSELFICILGTRYGQRPMPSGPSFTEHEIDCAFSIGLPVFAYFINEDKQRVLPRHVDVGDDHAALARLKVSVRNRVSPCFFDTPSDLAIKVMADVFKAAPNGKAREMLSLVDPAATRYRETAYDSIAKWYDYWYSDHWCGDEPYNTICDIVTRHSNSTKDDLSALKVLDTACGTGNAYVAFRKRGYNVYGCDGSKEMLKRALDNCKNSKTPPDGIIDEQITWTDTDAYLHHFNENSFDVLINTANSFCHVPPVPRYMDVALVNFHRLLKPGGLLIIDTKRYAKEGESEGVPLYKELRHAAPDWVIRTTREESSYVPGIGKVFFHTRLHYDVDPAFSEKVSRALIVLTVHSEDLTPQTALIPYYPLPADELQHRMTAVGFATITYPAMEDVTSRWKYDVVVGRKEG